YVTPYALLNPGDPTKLPLRHTDFNRQVSWYSKGRAMHTNICFAAPRRVTNSAVIRDSYLPMRRPLRHSVSPPVSFSAFLGYYLLWRSGANMYSPPGHSSP